MPFEEFTGQSVIGQPASIADLTAQIAVTVTPLPEAQRNYLMLGGFGSPSYGVVSLCADALEIPLDDMLRQIRSSEDFKVLMRQVFSHPDMQRCLTPPTPTTGCPPVELGKVRMGWEQCYNGLSTREAQIKEAEAIQQNAEATWEAKIPEELRRE